MRSALRRFGAIAVLSLAAGTANADPSVSPTGTTIYDPGQAYSSFILFSGGDDHTHLIDMDGHEVHRWDQAGFPSVLIDPALAGGQAGHVLIQASHGSGEGTSALPGMPTVLKDRSVGEVDWGGKTVWEWGTQVPGGSLLQHHDIRRLANGNTLIDEGISGRFFQVTPAGAIVWEYVSPYSGPYPGPGAQATSNWVCRAQPVSYAWAPAGTPHSEDAVVR